MNTKKEFNPNRNVEIFDMCVWKLAKIKDNYNKICSVLRYIRTFKNCRQMFSNYTKNHFPTRAIMRNGIVIEVNDRLHATILSHGFFNQFDIKDDFMIIRKGGWAEVRLHDWKKGDVFSIFLLEDHSRLDVIDKDVLDIGANIGDSPIYFLRKGARKIIALEPSEENFLVGIRNIKENGMENRITMLNYAIGAADGKRLVSERGNGIDYNIVEGVEREMTFVTLKALVKQFELNDAVMKMDCEGAEYDAILSAERVVLRKFKAMFIEYHYGYVNLKKKLESCGFTVSVKRPRHAMSPQSANPDLYMGHIFAKRMD